MADNNQGSDLVEIYENELNAQMPPECVEAYKRFGACYNEKKKNWINEKKSEENELTKPLGRSGGCRDELERFNNCYQSFNYQYMLLKNFAEVQEGRKPIFDLNSFEKFEKTYLTKLNRGLDKF